MSHLRKSIEFCDSKIQYACSHITLPPPPPLL
jgi:hypothetical protein